MCMCVCVCVSGCKNRGPAQLDFTRSDDSATVNEVPLETATHTQTHTQTHTVLSPLHTHTQHGPTMLTAQSSAR